MDELRGCVYEPPPIKDYRDKPQPTVYGPPPVKRGCLKWIMMFVILAAICAILVLIFK